MTVFVWLASYLKSGNTWTRLLPANFLADSQQAVHINRIGEALPDHAPPRAVMRACGYDPREAEC